MLQSGIEPVISFTGARDYARSAVASWTWKYMYTKSQHWQVFLIWLSRLKLIFVPNIIVPASGTIFFNKR